MTKEDPKSSKKGIGRISQSKFKTEIRKEFLSNEGIHGITLNPIKKLIMFISKLAHQLHQEVSNNRVTNFLFDDGVWFALSIKYLPNKFLD